MIGEGGASGYGAVIYPYDFVENLFIRLKTTTHNHLTCWRIRYIYKSGWPWTTFFPAKSKWKTVKCYNSVNGIIDSLNLTRYCERDLYIKYWAGAAWQIYTNSFPLNFSNKKKWSKVDHLRGKTYMYKSCEMPSKRNSGTLRWKTSNLIWTYFAKNLWPNRSETKKPTE